MESRSESKDKRPAYRQRQRTDRQAPACLRNPLTDARGLDGRDALWAHPDMLPTAEDLDDPDGFVHREAADFGELDLAALDKLLGAPWKS